MLPLIVLANRCTSPNRRSRRLRWSACWPSYRPRCALVVWFVIWPLCSSSMKRWLKANAPRCVSIRYKWEAQDFVKQRNVIELLKRIWQKCHGLQRFSHWELENEWIHGQAKPIFFEWTNLPITDKWRKWLFFGKVLTWHSYFPASSGWTDLQEKSKERYQKKWILVVLCSFSWWETFVLGYT